MKKTLEALKPFVQSGDKNNVDLIDIKSKYSQGAYGLVSPVPSNHSKYVIVKNQSGKIKESRGF